MWLPVAAAILLGLPPSLSHVCAAGEKTPVPERQPSAIQIYASADDSALPMGTLAPGEKPTPIAASQSGGGVKWFLVKAKSGIVGWIKQDDSEQAKQADNFFRALPVEPRDIVIPIPVKSAATAPGNTVLVPVTLMGGSVIVPVTFNGSVTANLLLDTGASMTMISRRLASNLALVNTGAGLFSGIGGTVSTQIGRVNSIKVGDAEVSALPVSIHDIPRFEGLLGMDFLSRFQVFVDPGKKLLMLTPR